MLSALPPALPSAWQTLPLSHHLPPDEGSMLTLLLCVHWAVSLALLHHIVHILLWWFFWAEASVVSLLSPSPNPNTIWVMNILVFKHQQLTFFSFFAFFSFFFRSFISANSATWAGDCPASAMASCFLRFCNSFSKSRSRASFGSSFTTGLFLICFARLANLNCQVRTEIWTAKVSTESGFRTTHQKTMR